MIALWQSGYKIRRIDMLCCLANLLIRYALILQTDICADVTGKDKHILLHLTDGSPQLIFIKLPDIHAIHGDASPLNIIIAPD